MQVVHTFDPSTAETESGRALEFEANPVYRVSSRIVRVSSRDLVLKEKKMACTSACVRVSVYCACARRDLGSVRGRSNFCHSLSSR